MTSQRTDSKVAMDAPLMRGQVSMLELQTMNDHRGGLVIAEGGRHFPFEIRRVYFLHSVPQDADRGGHAHRQLEQVMLAASGSFRIRTDDGSKVEEHWLNEPHQGLYVRGLVWREMDSFSSDAVCLVLASEHYDENDYFRDYNDFLEASLKLKNPDQANI